MVSVGKSTGFEVHLAAVASWSVEYYKMSGAMTRSQKPRLCESSNPDCSCVASAERRLRVMGIARRGRRLACHASEEGWEGMWIRCSVFLFRESSKESSSRAGEAVAKVEVGGSMCPRLAALIWTKVGQEVGREQHR